MLRIIVNGFLGGLGSVICQHAESLGVQIVAGVDMRSRNIHSTFPTFTDIGKCDIPADAIIECSIASVVPEALEFAVKNNIPIVVCTTGLSDAAYSALNASSEKIAVFKSANMSIGVNLVAKLLKKAINTLDGLGFDIEIVEKHHNKKLDAPSGTALMLADAINEEVDKKYEYAYNRSDVRELRRKSEIGIHSVRGGTIVGEHSVIFAGRDEIIEISHNALSKELFAIGALKAAIFISQKPVGLYNMQDMV